MSVLSVNQDRNVMRTADTHIKPHGYTIGGILEWNSSQEFHLKHLAIALRVLEPRPQALLIGLGYSEAEHAFARKIFNEYMKEVGLTKGKVIKITEKDFKEVGKFGVPDWVLGQLKDFFGA